MDKWQFAEHQVYGKAMMDSNESLGLFFSMGTGKTALALWWIRDAILDGRIMRALVVCPASLVASWNQAIDGMVNFEGFDEDDVRLLKRSVVVTSYQKMYHSERRPVKHRDGTVTKKREVSLRTEVDRTWGAVIVDESHGIGAHDSLQSKVAIKLGKLAKYRYILSGTPTHGGGGQEDFSKLYGQFQFLEQGNLWKGWTDFKTRYVVSVDPWGKPRKYNVQSCRALMQNHSIVCRLEDCYDMPGTREVEIDCPLMEPKMYTDIKDGRVEEYGIDIVMAGGQFIKLLQIVSGSMKRENDTLKVKTSKKDALSDILEGTDEKMVIFCNYRESVDQCAELCRTLKKRVSVYDGRSTRDTWKDLEDGKADVLICQYQSGGCGLNLQSAHLMVLYEPCLSALLLDQAKGRIYRKGQDKKCIYYILTTPGTIEHKVWKMVRNGMDVSNDMLERLAHGEDL